MGKMQVCFKLWNSRVFKAEMLLFSCEHMCTCINIVRGNVSAIAENDLHHQIVAQ